MMTSPRPKPDTPCPTPPAAGGDGPRTLVELVRGRARDHPDRAAFSYLENGEAEKGGLTYAELDRQARAIAALLQLWAEPGARALLLYPPDLGYVSAFLGCLYAGVVAVPAYPPRPNRPAPRIQAILNDCRPTLILTNAAGLEQSRRLLADATGAAHWLATDLLDAAGADQWSEPPISPESLAFLQYTSGSTASPRGVMLTHANLLHNLEVIHRAFGTSPQTRATFWLPLYHDMGLIGGVLEILYCGCQCTLMPAVAFLQRPARWLEAISRTRTDISGGPNFAYDLCVQKVTPQQRSRLDLSSWRLAFNGAEPIRPETLERFAEAFGPCGFRREAFRPCYGLAEAALLVASGNGKVPPLVASFDAKGLEEGRVQAAGDGREGARRLVGCGPPRPELAVRIVEPNTLESCTAKQVGEIWVSGESVAQGYWGQPELSERTFRARIRGGDGRPYLRTGDLGFLSGGELSVAGRLKDLMILRGRNHYPQDIEWTVQASHPALRPDAGAAFSVDVAGQERLVVVGELERAARTADLGEVFAAIRRAVAEAYELDVYAIRLLRMASIPRTSSGKIQRHVCREAFLKDAFAEEIGRWTQPAEVPPSQPAGQAAEAPPPDAEAIRDWLVERLARRLGLEGAAIDVGRPFAEFGLSSAQAVGLSGELQEWLGCTLAPTLLYAHPTIDSLAEHLGAGSAATPSGLSGSNAHVPGAGQLCEPLVLSERQPRDAQLVASPPADGEQDHGRILDEVVGMSEAELDAVLAHYSERAERNRDS
jgi:acyl-CoA synthetase (AMP-forming)/AMP-acid ligase II/acyl carrier protein